MGFMVGSINSVGLHILFIGLLLVLVLCNRIFHAFPQLPLIGLGVVVGLWAVFALYILGRYGGSLFVGEAIALNDYRLFSIALACIPLSLIVMMVLTVTKVPPIHDITTDISNPPVFIHAAAVRISGHNSTQYAMTNSELQGQAYPHIKTLQVDVSVNEAMKRAQVVVEQVGWKLYNIYSDDSGHYIEAYDQSAVFGFIDDIVIRVQGMDAGVNNDVPDEHLYQTATTHIDIRSASRVGVSDLGANARRITHFLTVLAANMNDRQ